MGILIAIVRGWCLTLVFDYRFFDLARLFMKWRDAVDCMDSPG